MLACFVAFDSLMKLKNRICFNVRHEVTIMPKTDFLVLNYTKINCLILQNIQRLQIPSQCAVPIQGASLEISIHGCHSLKVSKFHRCQATVNQKFLKNSRVPLHRNSKYHGCQAPVAPVLKRALRIQWSAECQVVFKLDTLGTIQGCR